MKTYCSKSWTDININFYNRTLRHCCKSAEYQFPEQLTVDFINNSTEIQQRRSQSLQGIAHADCASCWKSLAATGSAYRDWMNSWDDHYVTDNRTKLNDSAAKIIDIELDTTCDMSCLYCFADTSSKIAQEEGVEVKSKFNEQDYAVFKQWITEYLARTDHLHDEIVFNFLGGEPTASKRFYDLIEFIESAAAKSKLDVTVALCTNANTNRYLMKKLMSVIDKSQLLWSISISNEGFEQDAGLVRWGLDWNRFEENVKFYMSNPRIIVFSLTPSLNALNLKSFPNYVTWVHDLFDKHANNKVLSWYGNYIEHPAELDIANLTTDYVQYLDQVSDIIMSYKDNAQYHKLDQFEQFIESMKNRVGSINNPDYRQELSEFLDRKQRVKKTDKLTTLLKNIE
jgi:pyruvate-formate lyase-activating enzyme